MTKGRYHVKCLQFSTRRGGGVKIGLNLVHVVIECLLTYIRWKTWGNTLDSSSSPHQKEIFERLREFPYFSSVNTGFLKKKLPILHSPSSFCNYLALDFQRQYYCDETFQ